MKNCTPLWREAHFEVKMHKTHQVRTTFGSCDVEKVHAAVARSTFPSQNVQNTPFSDHFWKFRCRESARRCGAKHISKSKCTKHTRFGPLLETQMSQKCTPLWREAHLQVKMYRASFGLLLEVQMSKNCTPLWREAHFQVKMYKTHHSRTTFGSCRCRKSARRCGAKHISKSKCTKHTQVRTTFGSSDVEKVHAVVARSTFPSQNVQNTACSRHFWRFGCRKSARRCGVKHISKSKCTKHLMFAPLLEVRMLKKLHAVVSRSTFPSQNVQNTTVRATFGSCDVEKVHAVVA